MGLHLDLLIKKVWFCVFVCSNKKVQFRRSHFISDERKKERRSSFPYSLFQLLRSDFHVLRVIYFWSSNDLLV